MATVKVGDYFTLEGAAQALGLTYWQMYRLVRKHKVPTITIGKARLVRLEDLEGVKQA